MRLFYIANHFLFSFSWWAPFSCFRMSSLRCSCFLLSSWAFPACTSTFISSSEVKRKTMFPVHFRYSGHFSSKLLSTFIFLFLNRHGLWSILFESYPTKVILNPPIFRFELIVFGSYFFRKHFSPLPAYFYYKFTRVFCQKITTNRYSSSTQSTHSFLANFNSISMAFTFYVLMA